MALDLVRVTGALSVVAWEEVPYAPELLLNASSLPASIVAHADFAVGCADGYESYFGDELRPLSTLDVLNSVHGDVLAYLEWYGGASRPFSWYVGFSFGWLSALAKYQPAEADAGVQVLSSLSTSIDRYHYTLLVYGRRARCTLGADGWPLDL